MLPVKKLAPFAGTAGNGEKLLLFLEMVIRGIFPPLFKNKLLPVLNHSNKCQ